MLLQLLHFLALAKVEKLLDKAQVKQTYPPPPPIVRATDYDQTHSRHRQLAETWLLVEEGSEAINFGRQMLLRGTAPKCSLSGDLLHKGLEV